MIRQAAPSLRLASVLVGIILGVGLSSWLSGWGLVAGVVVVIDLIFLLLRRWPWRDRSWLLGLFAIGLALGIGRYALTQISANSVAQFTGDSHLVQGVIVKAEGSVTRQKFTLGRVEIAGEQPTGRILVHGPGYPRLQTGDEVSFVCELEAPEPFDGFSYDRYLASKRIYATCFLREAPFLIGQAPGFWVLDRIRTRAVVAIERIFGDPQAALLAGLLMGDDNFSDAWKERFLRTGTSHVVAASGYNVSVLAIILLAILVSLGLRRQWAYPLLLAGIAGFVLIAGAEAAVTRAGIMGALALTATQLGRKTTPRNILLLTVAAMLLLEPRLLRDDVGFQLSVLSTVGLVTTAKYFSDKFSFIPETLGLRESFAATVAATLATLPVVIFGFGKISIISPLVNLLILPFVPYAMLTGALAVMVGLLDQSLGALLAGPAWLCLTAMLEIIQATAALPFAVVKW